MLQITLADGFELLSVHLRPVRPLPCPSKALSSICILPLYPPCILPQYPPSVSILPILGHSIWTGHRELRSEPTKTGNILIRIFLRADLSARS